MISTDGDTGRTGTDNRVHTSDTTVNSILRHGDRNTKQKLSIPSLEKRDSTGAKLWWRRFIQYIKMTHRLDLSDMTTDKGNKAEFREHLDVEIEDIFIWALGEAAIKEMTLTVREHEPSVLTLKKLYSLFRLRLIPKRKNTLA